MTWYRGEARTKRSFSWLSCVRKREETECLCDGSLIERVRSDVRLVWTSIDNSEDGWRRMMLVNSKTNRMALGFTPFVRKKMKSWIYFFYFTQSERELKYIIIIIINIIFLFLVFIHLFFKINQISLFPNLILVKSTFYLFFSKINIFLQIIIFFTI